MKEYILRGVAIVLCLFTAGNLLWFGWRQLQYAPYIRDMEKETVFSTFLVPRYAAKDADGFDYSVKYPDYLSLTGNLAVGVPTTEDTPFSDGLIVWPKLFGGYEYGVILNNADGVSDGYMFYIDAEGNAVDAQYDVVAREYADVIGELLKRAKGFWQLTD